MIKKFISNSTKYAFGANLTIQMIIGLGQLIAVPIYLKYWGGDNFGRWVLILGFVSTLSMMDFGVAGVASNEIIKAMACRDDEKVALNLKIIKVATKIIFSMMASVGGGVVFYSYLGGGSFDVGQVSFSYSVIGGIFLYSSIMVIFNSAGGVVRSFGGNATFSCIAAWSIFAETSFAPLSAFLGFSIEFAFYGLMLIRLVGFLLLFLIACEQVKNVNIDSCSIDRGEFFSVVRKSIATMLVPGAIAAQLQVPLLVLASALSPQTAAGYSTARTLARVIFQFSYIYPRSILPKFTKYFSLSNHEEINKIYKKLNYIIYIFTLTGCIIYATAGSYVFERWTGGKYLFDRDIFLFMGAAVFFHGYWFILISLLISINRHSTAAIQCLLVTFVSCGIIFYIGSSLYILCISVLIMEICLTFICIRQCLLANVRMFGYFKNI